MNISEERNGNIGAIAGLKDFVEKKYKANDGSVISFGGDGHFEWYQSYENREDNYYKGTFDLYFGETAVAYLEKELPQYGVTKEKMKEFFERNRESSLYRMNQFCCMVLHNEEFMMNGENRAVKPNESYYMGFYAEGYFDAANLQTGNYAGFTLCMNS